MLFNIVTALSLATAAMAAPTKRGTGISITPHDKFSSSVGVLGCKINTNRVAYWPRQPGCDSVCVKVSMANGRSVHLLQIDTSGGAYDISYDAYNYLVSGKSATEGAITGGGYDATYESAPMSDCADLLYTSDKSLPLMAANSIGYYIGCPVGSWVRDTASLWNIQNSVCTLGYDEQCQMPDLAVGNQPTCPHTLGIQTPLTGMAVENIDYGTGAISAAVQ